MASTETGTGGVAGWAVDLMERLGGVGAGVAIAVESIFPPIPSELILPLAGFAAARGDMSLSGAIAWTTAGSVLGAMVLYLLGAVVGRERLHRLAERLPMFSSADLARSEDWFRRHGHKAVFFGRMIPVVRSLVSVPAGVQRMPVAIFLLLTAAGSAVWNAVLVIAGYHLGENWEAVTDFASQYSLLVMFAAVVAISAWIRGKRRAAASAAPAGEDG